MKRWIWLAAALSLLSACDRGAVPQRQSSNEGKAAQSAAGGTANEGKAARSAAGR
jgi:hypothetical protein